MFRALIDIILKLFGKKPIVSDGDVSKNNQYAKAYQDITDINLTAIFANKLASLCVTDSDVSIADKAGKENKRTAVINAAAQSFLRNWKKYISTALGTGGAVAIPYVANGDIYTDIVPQSRYYVTGALGDKVMQATVLADQVTRDSKTYYRWTDYELSGLNYIIRNRASTDSGNAIPLNVITDWAGIAEEYTISGVDRLLLASMQCPIDSRQGNLLYGVPITYGCDKIITDINTTLGYIADEYENKQVMLGVDNRLLGKNNEKTKLFKMLTPSGGDVSFWEIFDPAIRDSSYFARLTQLFELLEKAVGTSKGILTEPVTSGATATEIKAAQYDTFSMISSIRCNFESAFSDLAYAYDVLAEHFNLSPAGGRGQYSVSYEWDWSLFESSTETFTQMDRLNDKGLLSGAKLNAYVTGQTVEEAQAEIDYIKANEPTTAQLLGTQ